ncbi:MAG: ribonuclease H-like domain-containing protein [Oscillospiraceae bacterium]|jgi:uncharacterized protein YprB with RNaseH-like and TPR domain|nr:ribonuclease H-like domain-containing protein [Oscillospiraceae bacterium]
MIRNLESKLRKLAESADRGADLCPASFGEAGLSRARESNAPAPAVETACWARDETTPLREFDGLLDVTVEHARLLRGESAGGGLSDSSKISGVSDEVPREASSGMGRRDGVPRDLDGSFDSFDSFNVRRALFVDTETTGLRGSGTVAFLIGVGWLEGERFVTRQLLMRDYSQESSQLNIYADMLQDAEWIVSFNGKSFDVPLLRDRFIMNRLTARWRELPQLDLLHAARRVWKLRLGSCTLQRLESEIMGMPREDDLPGSLIPERYFEYLRTSDFSLLEDILLHNARDVRSLALLLGKLARTYDGAHSQESPLDVYALGRSLDRAGETERARQCYKRAAATAEASERARAALAESYRKSGEWLDARAVLEQMTFAGEGGVKPYVELAKLSEHRQHNAADALRLTRAAMMRALPGELPDLEKRRRRLIRKLGEDGG